MIHKNIVHRNIFFGLFIVDVKKPCRIDRVFCRHEPGGYYLDFLVIAAMLD